MENLTVDLGKWTVIKVSGPDKNAYLNGIITYDLEQLGSKKICQSMFLTPKAKIRSIFWLAESNQEYLIYAPEKMKTPLIEDLLKYKLDMNVKLEDITQEIPHLYLVEVQNDNLFSIDWGGHHFNFDQSDDQKENLISYQEFVEWLVINGSSPVEVLLDENPFEVGLADAVTLEKGCFLGQEPLSRMFHRGRPRQFLYRITSEIELPDQIIISNEEVGRVLYRVKQENKYYNLCMIKSSVSVKPNILFDNFSHKSIIRVGSYPKINR